MAEKKSRRRHRSANGQARPYRDGERWVAPHRITFADGSTRKVRGTGSTQLKAQDSLKRLIAEATEAHERDVEVRESGNFVNPATEKWLRDVGPTAREFKTLEGYWHAYRVWIEPRFLGVRLAALDYQALSALQREVLSSKSASTWRQVRTLLNHVLNEAARQGVIASNPMTLLANTKGPVPRLTISPRKRRNR